PRLRTASCFSEAYADHRDLRSFPTRRSSDLGGEEVGVVLVGRGFPVRLGDLGRVADAIEELHADGDLPHRGGEGDAVRGSAVARSEEHTSELQSRENLVCRLLLEKKKRKE